MSFSQQQIMERAMRLAIATGADAHSSPVVDNKFLAEDYFPLALREAVKNHASNKDEADALKRTYEMVLVSGATVLPDSVIKDCLDCSSVSSPDNSGVADLSSYVARYVDFIRPAYPQLGYYTIKNTQFLYREPSGAPDSSYITLSLVAVGLPDIPSVITSPITISTGTAEETIKILAAMIKGNAG